MQGIWMKQAAWAVVVAAGLAGLVWFAWPQPALVDLAVVARGPMEVTVDDDGKTNVRHIYTVSAPIAGKVLRISHPAGEEAISVHVGDQVTANQTVVALMQPTSPGFIDVRSREEAQAAVAAAEAYVKYTESEVRRLEAAVAFYRTELGRSQALARTQSVSIQALDKAKFDAETNEAALASAKAQVDVWEGVRRTLAARLIDPSTPLAPTDPGSRDACGPGGIPQSVRTGNRGAAGPCHDRFRRSARSLVLARTRFPGGRARYNLEWPRRPAGPSKRPISEG